MPSGTARRSRTVSTHLANFKLQIPANSLDSFLCQIEQGYMKYSNPYHNNLHAADGKEKAILQMYLNISNCALYCSNPNRPLHALGDWLGGKLFQLTVFEP